MKQLRNILNKILEVLAGVSFFVMVVLTCWQVFTRYVLQNPSSWSEELVSYMFAWMALLGASIVVGERGHMNIPVVVERMGKGAQMFFSIFSDLRIRGRHPGIRRRTDHHSGHGADDLLPGCPHRYFLRGAPSERRTERGLYHHQYL